MIALWREATRKTSLVLLPLFAFLMAMAADLIGLLYGPASPERRRISHLPLPAPAPDRDLGPDHAGDREDPVNLHASLVILIANVAVAPALVGPLGLIGPALAAPCRR